MNEEKRREEKRNWINLLLGNGEVSLTTESALKLLSRYDQKIRNSAYKIYNKYEANNEVNNTLDKLKKS